MARAVGKRTAVVPNRAEVERRLGPNPSDAEVKDLVRSELKRIHDEQNLRTFDVPRDFLLEWEPFSHENGLLSSVQKRLRPALRAKYGPALEDLYVELERRQNEELAALRDPNSTLTVLLSLPSSSTTGTVQVPTFAFKYVAFTSPFVALSRFSAVASSRLARIIPISF